MQKFWWPEHELQLLRELQRQQQSTQFCDTLLQTEALSPYLSEKLSSCPLPPSGERRQLQLRNVKAKTLVKLVGLLYSGVLEVKGVTEKSDVLAAAHAFGITDLVEGQKYVEVKEGMQQGDCKSFGICKENGREWHENSKKQDAQVQVDVVGGREERSCASVGTQTVSETSVDTSVICSGYTKPPTAEPESSGCQSLNLAFCLEPTPTHASTPRPAIPSDEESTLTQSSNPASTTPFSGDAVTFPVNSDFSFAHKDSVYQELSESGDIIQALVGERTGVTDGTNGEVSDNGGDAELPGQVTGDETVGAESAETTEKTGVCASVGLKNLAEMERMQQMVETTQISVKVKLRRQRTEGEAWEVVSMQDTDETFSVLASLKQDCSRRPQADADSTDDLSREPDVLTPQPAASNQLQLLSTNTPTLSDVSFSPNQTDKPESAPLSQHHGSAEESDEQIGKLLEDIMMSLNILSTSMCQDPGTEEDAGQSQLHSAAQCNHCPSDESATGIHCCFAAQNQPTSESRSAPPSDVLQQQQQQQRSAWYDSSDGSLEPSDAISCQEKLHYPQFQQAPSQDDQHVHQLLPLVNENDTQLGQTFPLPCMDEFRLPPCLSPLESCTSVTTQQLHLSSSCNDLQQQQSPWQQRRPWLSENPGSLTFPLSAGSQSWWSKQCLGHVEQNPKNVGTCAETFSEADLQLQSKEITEALKCKQDEPAGGAAAPRRKKKCTGHQKNASRGNDGTKQARIRTRSFVKKELASDIILGNSALLVPVIHRAKITDTQGLLFPTGTCGGPRKKTPEESVPVDEDGELQMGEDVSKETEEKQTSRRCDKRKRSTSEEEPKNTASAAENKDDTTKLRTPKRPKMVSLKDFQKLLRRQHSTTTSKNKDKQVTDEDRGVLSLDENHNQLLHKHREDTNSSANENSGSTFNDEEDVARRLQSGVLMKTHDEGGADSHQSAISQDEDLPHSNTRLPQETNAAPDHDPNPKPEKTGPPVSGSEDVSRTEEGEEEEVDILLYSPEKDPQGRACEFGLNGVDMTADEEEEEEERNDIDVTGDEAE
ncbi:uncharacterized protein LOC114445139 [Parambassis ranga]|uniref:Uncharacterized protein LOC114445139 n=1 Tax=Parambassis ranga TaxID=210632 RepID=A0A6P7JGN6_9TELE|nr:uncharacterized protein LOC114445139 [Parambassis ranga]